MLLHTFDPKEPHELDLNVDAVRMLPHGSQVEDIAFPPEGKRWLYLHIDGLYGLMLGPPPPPSPS